MMRVGQLLSVSIGALLAAGAFGAASAQERPGKVMMPWQKPQPRAHATPNLSEILPWLAGDRDDKKIAAPSAGTPWATEINEPQDPVVPDVADPGAAAANPIETGAIAPSGLVLKKPLPVVNVKGEKGSPEPADATAAATAKIKKSIMLPGDQPVGQEDATEVSPNAAPAAREAEAEAAADVPAALAAPVGAAQKLEVPAEAAAHGAQPVVSQGEVATAQSGAPRDSISTTATADTLAAATPAGNTAPLIDAPAAAAATVAPAAVKQTAQAVAPEAAEGIPPLPPEDEAQPIPDPLPEAMVTPVARPATPELSVQKARELPQAVDAAAPTAPAGAPATNAAPRAPATTVSPAAPTTAQAAEPTAAPQSKPRLPGELADGATVAQQYCFNIADAAKDARYAWQKKTLAEIEQELQKRIALLDERTAEYQKWLARRDEFIRNAEENVVKIYAGMKPDAASVQLTLMNEESAAAVLSKLSTRNASAILNEMEPAKAAKLTMIITGAAKLKRKRELLQQQQQPQQQPAVRSDAGAPAAPVEGNRS